MISTINKLLCIHVEMKRDIETIALRGFFFVKKEKQALKVPK